MQWGDMLREVRVIAAIAVGLLGACGQAEEEEIVAVEPETEEPRTSTSTSTGTAEPGTAEPVTAAATVAPATAAPATATAGTVTKVAKVTKVRRAPVIVYQATWCTPCHNLSAHLTRRGIRHVNKDIDSTPGALDEMNAKTARAGHAGASLPVMDFRGRIVIGYDPAAVDRMCDEDLAAGAG